MATIASTRSSPPATIGPQFRSWRLPVNGSNSPFAALRNIGTSSSADLQLRMSPMVKIFGPLWLSSPRAIGTPGKGKAFRIAPRIGDDPSQALHSAGLVEMHREGVRGAHGFLVRALVDSIGPYGGFADVVDESFLHIAMREGIRVAGDELVAVRDRCGVRFHAGQHRNGFLDAGEHRQKRLAHLRQLLAQEIVRVGGGTLQGGRLFARQPVAHSGKRWREG